MWTALLTKIPYRLLVWLILILAISVGISYWINWTVEANRTLALNQDTIAKQDNVISGLRDDIMNYTLRNNEMEERFKPIEESQVDLLCAARYNQPISIVEQALPVIKEVVVYRNKLTQCPTTDIEQAEPLTHPSTVYRPSNEEVAIGVLDNSWKAFCAAIHNEDPLCTRSP